MRRAELLHQELQRRLAVQDGVPVEGADRLGRRLLQVVLRLGPHVPAVLPAPGLIRREAAAVHHEEPDVGKALDDAAEHQRRCRDGGVERIADQVVEIVVLQTVGTRHVVRVHHAECRVLVCHLPHRLERRIVQVLAHDVGADLHALEIELRDGALQLVGGRLRRLHRQRCDAVEVLRIVADVPGDLVVLDDRGRGREPGILIVEEGLRRVGQHLHVHVRRLHVLEPLLDIEAAARQRPVRHAGHRPLEHVLLDLLERRRDLRHLLVEEIHGLLGADVGVRVDRQRIWHWSPRKRHGRACPGHPRLLSWRLKQVVDTRHKAGHNDGEFRARSSPIPSAPIPPRPGSRGARESSAPRRCA